MNWADRKLRRGRTRREHPWTLAGFFSRCLGILGLWLPIGLVIATPATHAEIPRRGGTLRLAFENDPHTLDPALIWSNNEGTLACLVFNTLLDIQADGSLVPLLARSLPEISSDGLTYSFRLRPGVLFSNGRELTADDVVYSLERHFDPRTGAMTSGYFKSIRGHAAFKDARLKESIATIHPTGRVAERWIEPRTVEGLRSPDRYTLAIQLDYPDLALGRYLASPVAAIVPREEVELHGESFGSHPVGSGPFILKEWVRGIRCRFGRNPRYFIAGQPHLDAVEVLLNVDFTTQAMMMDRGEIDYQFLIHDADYLRYRNHSAALACLELYSGTSPIYVTLNCELPPFTNLLVRRAMNHAVNKPAIVKKLLNRAVPACGALPMSVRGYNPNLPSYAYHPPRAKALLAEAGLGAGFTTELWFARDNPAFPRVALAVQHDLHAIGVIAHLKEVVYPTLVEAIMRRKAVPMAVFDWGATIDDPKDTLDSLLNPDNISDEGCMNVAFYSNEQVRQLFRIANREFDSQRRIQRYQEIEQMVVREAPWIFICQGNTETARQRWLKGFRPRGIWPSSRLEATWIDR